MKPKMRKFPYSIKAGRHLSKVDAKLAKVIAKVGAVKIEIDPDESIFESLTTAIIYQQLHGKAAATILSRFVAHFKEIKNFPTPEEILKAKEDDLRALGLSQNKMLAIKDLALKVSEGVIPDSKAAAKMSDLELIETFTKVRGIGEWTAQMLLIFTLARPDVLPTADYGVRKGFAAVFGKKTLPTPKQLEAIGKKWSPYRSAAAWYFWRATELPEFKGKP